MNAVAFIGGVAVILIPISIYFIYHGALYEMIYGTLLFNLKYMEVGIRKLPLIKLMAQQIMTLLPTIIPSIVIVLLYRKDRKYRLIIFIIAFSISFYFSINTGHRYIYYHMLNAIPFSLGIMLLIRYFEVNKNINKLIKLSLIFMITMSISLYIYLGRDLFQRLRYQIKTTYNVEAKELANNIPINERNDVLGYNTSSQWFMATDILPITRFYTNQDWWNLFDSIVTTEIEEVLINNRPKWIITYNVEDIQDDEIKEIIKNNYILIDSNNTGQLYNIKDYTDIN